MSTSVCWELTCYGLVPCPGGVKYFHPLRSSPFDFRGEGGERFCSCKNFFFFFFTQVNKQDLFFSIKVQRKIFFPNF